MIYYFSATGNSQYAAEKIAAATGDMARFITAKGGGSGNPNQFGFVTPTYAWELPSLCRDFLKRGAFTIPADAYVFIVSTCGVTPGASGAEAKHLLNKRGIAADALFSVQMPDTWTPIFDLSDPAKNAAVNAKADQALDAIIKQIQKQEHGNFQSRAMPRGVRIVTHPIYEGLRQTFHFRVEDACIGCGLCAKSCPDQAITLRRGRPVWTKTRCAMCLRCLHRCPVFAIQYGFKTKGHGQYVHPPYKN
ncbi:EFR1 family ferrodoxin [Pseudoramibacter sp.]|jgi:NAD-dependent dihydropyrimidine dehydrogenase PreA subunit|uniref:EFR1 family ferrodoxin n=1 Tax=Pseudoramibacter sp. TaxID=2034862 RepID=UPI0025DFD8EA|nr:EFR1 family ferrodoxin [Pseudoramibacter sp.]MCH4073189.1 EFR1 family ferrodoxin [Pseudoramibacter sp.]MCH4106961.1 EFR1 family ferrodoxin [Pseudoramibacter sp.]